jgi:hypothetical protein
MNSSLMFGSSPKKPMYGTQQRVSQPGLYQKQMYICILYHFNSSILFGRLHRPRDGNTWDAFRLSFAVYAVYAVYAACSVLL